ncbi:hypothetical protein LSTR_LSTR005573 [Laodelphax striatellus]|uniref:Uncharacterized protein n=1 Tax=Laodelphax striatellus TaxID=195883 RepID=A0A482WY16_LAOST|nr:hypothetical protein LSTR_LSTR005573 [Laodelphax striatellus]
MLWHVYVSIYHFVIMLLGFKQVANSWNVSVKSTFFEHGRSNLWKFLSVWVQVLTQLYYLTHAIIYVRKKNNTRKKSEELNLQLFLNNTYFSLIFPLTMLICFGFWGLFIIDRKIIYPEEMDDYFPFFYCHIYHTIPAVIVFIELLRGYLKTPTYSSTIRPLAIATTVYISILFKTYAEEKKWMYLVFYKLTLLQSIAGHVFFFSIVPMILLQVGIYLNNWVITMRKLMENNDEKTSNGKFLKRIPFLIFEIFK